MALAIPDWSREILRKRPGIKMRFRTERSRDGSVAVAETATERPLTMAEIAVLAALASPCVLPAALREQIPDSDHVLARLVLDGLVEMRRGPRFLSGVAALGSATGKPDDGGAESSRISELALHYALAIHHLPPEVISARLYAFNSLPRIAASGDPGRQFAAMTGIEVESPAPRLGGKEWSMQMSGAWVYFRRGSPFRAHFKIYCCPRLQSIRSVIPEFIEALGRARASIFKIAFPAGLLARADKIVAYFPSFEAVQRTLSCMASMGLDAPAQAVPFSAPVPGTQLLSWGVDPPSLPSRKASSWRSWVTRQVAECAHGIPGATPTGEALDVLKAALQLRDIDPVLWLPRQELVSRKWRLEL